MKLIMKVINNLSFIKEILIGNPKKSLNLNIQKVDIILDSNTIDEFQCEINIVDGFYVISFYNH